jgi:prepilin-type processing-associated H-X9-DG protein/prepilin-type N-terminal cleavage/methylation domain-containing protein
MSSPLPIRTRTTARNARRRDGRLLTGFTLVELLVVVSIISLMMALLLPSLTRAQKQGEQIHCLANQHQLHLAWTLFSTDNDDRLCRTVRGLKPYVPLEEVFFCTSDNTARRNSPSYGLSNTMGGEFRDGVMPDPRQHKIVQPSDSLVFTDKAAYSSECFWPLLRDSENKRWLWRPPDLFGVGGITSRHGNGGNMTFADGHGERTPWKDVRTLQLIKGLIGDEVAALVVAGA